MRRLSFLRRSADRAARALSRDRSLCRLLRSGIAPSAGAFAPSSDYPGVCSWWPSGPTPCQPWLAEAPQAPVADSNTQVAASPGRTCHHGPHTCPAQLPIPFHISRTATSHRTHVRSIRDARSSRRHPMLVLARGVILAETTKCKYLHFRHLMNL